MLGIDVVGHQGHRPPLASPAVGVHVGGGDVIDLGNYPITGEVQGRI